MPTLNHAVLLLCLAAGQGVAADRPYLATSSAAAEEDDDQVWSLENTVVRKGPVRGLSVAPEYAFNPTSSVQFEFSHARERGSGLRESGFEVEFKHLFNHIARDGWGWGVNLGAAWSRSTAQGWRAEATHATLAWTLALWQNEGQLHVNAGLTKPAHAGHEWKQSLALERRLAKGTTGFVEWAREGSTTLAHLGLRQWLKRDKLALDFSIFQSRAAGLHEPGWVLGLAWYDL